MKFLRLIAFLFVFQSASSQSFIPETIESNKLKENRTFTVYLPKNYEANVVNKYPVMLVLDGEYLAQPINGILNYSNYWDDLPEIIIVAVNQNYAEKRYIDSEFDENGLPSGSGAKFFEFIGLELLPYVEKKYRTLPFRIIAGHDTTASFLNAYLYKDNPVFDAYISLGAEFPTAMETRVADRLKSIKKNIFYYHASADGDITELKEKAIALDENIKNSIPQNLKYRFNFFENASHYSLVAKAIPEALYFIFDRYQPISMVEFQEKISKLESGYTNYLIEKYTYLNQNLGLEVKPRLTDFKAIEAAILKNNAFAELQELSKYAEKHYPKTTLSVYHQALYFEKTGEFKKAIKEYQKGYSKEAIRELSKDFMLSRAEALKGKPDQPKEETNTEIKEE